MELRMIHNCVMRIYTMHNIRTGLCAMVDEPLVEIPDQSFNGVPLNCFSSVTLQEIRHIILKAPSKSCELDPLPSWLLKECVDELSPIVTSIVNASLNHAIVPLSLTRCTRGDARSFFLYLQNVFVCTKLIS